MLDTMQSGRLAALAGTPGIPDTATIDGMSAATAYSDGIVPGQAPPSPLRRTDSGD